MKHEEYKELLELGLMNELNDQEKIDLENHLLECEECSLEFKEMKRFYNVISSEGNFIPTEIALENSRKRLFNTINFETNSKNEKISDSWFAKIIQNKISFAFGGVALILTGLLIGYFFLTQKNIEPNLYTNKGIDLDKLDSGEIQISKVNFPDIFSEKGEYEFKLAGEKSLSYKGTLQDDLVQKLLAAAIRETENPGLKIKTAKSVKEFLPKGITPDEKIKNAFIQTLKSDSNPGVRKEALQALVNFPYDKSIRDALLFTLDNDDNASNRIDAINALLAMNKEVENINDSVKTNLEQKINNEENEVVKFRTAKLLLGGK